MTDTSTNQWTLQRLLEWTTSHFTEAGSDSSRLDAEVLLAEALQCPRIELYTRFAEVPPAEPMAKFREWVKRRAAGEPVAYLVGHKEFYSLRFKVTPATLIPRPETEHLIVAALEASKGFDQPVRIVDVGTGSGCIAVTLAKQLEKEFVIAATDISLDALAVARENAEAHEVSSSIRFYEGDLLGALPEGSKPVHMIVSNPPYIGRCEIDTVEDTVKDFEPETALFAGEKGTEIIQQLIPQAEKMLLPGGYLIFEASPNVMEQCESIVNQSALELVEVINDYAGLKRILVAKQKA
jgi:release factor glutamine methyltransferase